MAQFTGMDIQQVRALSAQMDNAANEIGQLAQTLTSRLNETHWVGPDQQRFVSDWESQHRAQLNNVVEALRNASRLATQNANEQEQVSNQ